ncbi:type VI secretion system protein TssL, long form [Roseomonas sp. CCTCC AB2023176]|uniref:type VI secretion system protein TssL, long form n=1 Tax=Roseomonas sp. CCTCC AB2023176 TaxID=3342640 RepID=UPI0035DCA8D1
MSDNPFDEAGDSDRTVMRGPAPRPGAAPLPPQPFAPDALQAPRGPAAPAPILAAGVEALPRIGVGPLAAAAAPLLEILARIGTGAMTAAPEPGELRERTLTALREFEREATGIASPEEMREAHYVLCAALDDVVLSTAWGARSAWAAGSLGSTFHRDVRTGEHVFDRLTQMQREPGRFRGALEIGFLALSLGLIGKFRLMPNGPAEHERFRTSLYQLLLNLRGAGEKELSPHWRGVDAPHRAPGARIPAWVALPVALLAIGGAWFWASDALGNRAEDLERRIAALPPGMPPEIQRVAVVVPPAPPPPPPPDVPRPPDATDSLRRFLAPEIAQGLVGVESDAQRILVRIKGTGMFPSGSATLDPRFVNIMERIGQGLKDEPGAVTVLGHSDNVPIRTLRFPSNGALSQARAEAAMDVIRRANGEPSRFRSDGRGDAEPVANNATPEGREANRRIEVLLRREGAR